MTPEPLTIGTPEKNPGKKHAVGELRGEFLLLITAIIWGMAFVAQRSGAADLDPFVFNFYRYAMATIAMLPVLLLHYARLRHAAPVSGKTDSGISGPGFNRMASDRRWVTLGGAFLLAFILFGGSSFQQAGLSYTSAGRSGFITGLYVILVPLFGLFAGKRVGLGLWGGAVLAVLGLWFLNAPGKEGLAGAGAGVFGRGEVLTLASALCWAFQILANAWFAPRVALFPFVTIQFALVTILSGLVALSRGAFVLPTAPATWLALAYTGLLANALAFVLQLEGQKRAHPARASLVMSLESPFAATFGCLFLGEELGMPLLMGGGLMFAGIVAAQLDPDLFAGLFKRRRI